MELYWRRQLKAKAGYVAMAISGTYSLINYLKYLLLFSLITGSVTGFMLTVLMPRIERTNVKEFKEMSK